MKRIMYIECKGGGLEGTAIGWSSSRDSRRSYYYAGRRFKKTKSGYKYNCLDAETGEAYWISGPKEDGTDRLYGGVVEIDEDAREEYWTSVRGDPGSSHRTEYRS